MVNNVKEEAMSNAFNEKDSVYTGRCMEGNSLRNGGNGLMNLSNR